MYFTPAQRDGGRFPLSELSGDDSQGYSGAEVHTASIIAGLGAAALGAALAQALTT